jgi:hypothetical protein
MSFPIFLKKDNSQHDFGIRKFSRIYSEQIKNHQDCHNYENIIGSHIRL